MTDRDSPTAEPEDVSRYPRPPALVDCNLEIRIIYAGEEIACSTRCKRVLETHHPPTYYVPPEDVRDDVLVPASDRSFCEWKGVARYHHVLVGKYSAERAAWSYPQPQPHFEGLRDYVAFYAHLMDACYVAGERVQAQAGGFYGGWITSHVTGPFKGPPGTQGW